MTVQWSARPQLRRPALVAAFEGWNDAAGAATDAVELLGRLYGAEPFAEIAADEYFDFQAARPRATIAEGVVTAIAWPRTSFLTARAPAAPHDLVLLLGVEPNLRWPAFCAEVLGVAHDCGCEMLVTLGALLAEVPHTRPVHVTGVADDPATMSRLHLRRSHYEGPTGIVGSLHAESRRMSMPSVSLWAPVPHYVATPPNPKATRALLDRLRGLLALPLDLSELDVASASWESQIDLAASDDSDVREYVRSLEERYDSEEAAAQPDAHAADDLPSGDALAADFERYLRDQDDEG